MNKKRSVAKSLKIIPIMILITSIFISISTPLAISEIVDEGTRSQPPQPESQGIFYSEDFDGYNDGDIPDSNEWKQGTGNYDPQIFQVDDDQQWQSAPNSLWMRTWITWYAFCRHTNSTSFADYTITFDVYINVSNGWYYFSTTEGELEWQQEQSLQQMAFRMNWNADATITYHDGTQWVDTGMTYTVGWYNFTIRHNDTDDKIDIWINNNHVMNWVNYRNTGLDGIRGMHFGISSSGLVYRDVFIDNFKIESEDLPLPQFSNVTDTPDPQQHGDYVNISCNITNGVGIDSAWVNISGIGNYSMNQGSGNLWYLNQTYSVLGTHSYFITANDTSNSWNNTGSFTFTIYDIIAPRIYDVSVSPVPQEYNENINITATIINGVAVDTAYVNVTGLGNYSMTQGSGYYWHLNQSFSASTGLYTFHIATNDTSDNWNTSSGHFFILEDTTAPEIEDIDHYPHEQESGGYMNITANVTDFSGVNATILHIKIITPTGTSEHIMDQGSGNQYYLNTTYVLNSEVQYSIWSNDTWDNVNQTGYYSFWVNDTTPPDLDILFTPPPETVRTESINFTTNVTDIVDIYGVWINFTNPDGSYSNESMEQGSGDEWFYNFTFDDVGIYTYHIVANDSAGNWAMSGEYSFEIEMTQNDFLYSLILILAIMFAVVVITRGILGDGTKDVTEGWMK